VDDPGGEAEAPKPAAPWRAILISFACAGILAALLVSHLLEATKIADAPRLVGGEEAPLPAGDTLALAQRVADSFVEALHAGDAAGAYSQMARPYREGATLETFRAAWRTPLLAGAHAFSLSRATETAMPKGVTFTARGMLHTDAGALQTTLTFLREGDDAHVLAVFVGGVPVVQGLGPSLPSPRR
jgi:hypothetical protein